MSFDRIRVDLFGVQPAYQMVLRVWAAIKPALIDGMRLQLEIREETRRDNHNRHFHWQIGHIAKQDRLHGQEIDAEGWKRLLIDAFKFDTKDDADLANEWAKFGELRLLPALNHAGFVAVGEQSRNFTIKLAKAFIVWLDAYCVERDVKLPAWREEESTC